MKALAIILFLMPCLIFAHGGGTKKSGPLTGCHHNRKQGGFHCHSKSPYNGSSWASEEDALRFITGDISKKKKKYSRKLFGGWIDRDGDCQNERQELLIRESKVKVTFNKRKSGKSCTVKSGLWDDFYYPETLTDASLIDIDHIVPLKHAFDLGAGNWPRKKRVEFANDPLNLVITDQTYNRQKGAKTPNEWMPSKRDYACKYFKRYFEVKNKYELEITIKEKDYFKILDCSKYKNTGA